MFIDTKGLDFIIGCEGFSATPYLCQGGYWTQGYGHIAGVTKDSKPVDEDTALEWLRQDIAAVERAVGRMIVVPLTQGQINALVSFTFNLGPGRLRASTLRKKVNAELHEEVPDELMKWVIAGGKRSRGLIRRRRAEAAMYMEGL